MKICNTLISLLYDTTLPSQFSYTFYFHVITFLLPMEFIQITSCKIEFTQTSFGVNATMPICGKLVYELDELLYTISSSLPRCNPFPFLLLLLAAFKVSALLLIVVAPEKHLPEALFLSWQ